MANVLKIRCQICGGSNATCLRCEGSGVQYLRRDGKTSKPRNWLALMGILRGGAGRHPDRRKQASQRACRGPVRSED